MHIGIDFTQLPTHTHTHTHTSLVTPTSQLVFTVNSQNRLINSNFGSASLDLERVIHQHNGNGEYASPFHSLCHSHLGKRKSCSGKEREKLDRAMVIPLIAVAS